MARSIIVISFLMVIFEGNAFGQDLPFSQFYTTQALLNPAMTGKIDRDFRFTSNYRNQWQSISEPFKTLALNYDMPVYRDNFHTEYFGLGLGFYNEKAGLTELKSNIYQLNMAYHTKTSRYTTVSFGLTGAFGIRSIDYSQIKWESQHNGNNYDAGLESGENNLSGRFNYWDFNTGILWDIYDPDYEINYEFGASVFHITGPKQSFAGGDDSRLGRRYQINGKADIPLSSIDLIPQLVLTSQRNYYGFIAGGMVRIKPDEPAESKYTDFNLVSSISFGAYYRYKDAVIIQAYYDYKHTLMVGLSYDITLSRLRTYNSYSGAYEISLIYTGIFKDNRIKVKNKGTKEKEKDKVNTRRQ